MCLKNLIRINHSTFTTTTTTTIRGIKMSSSQQQNDIESKILSELTSNTSSSSSTDVKKLRKIILLQLQTDSDDKSAKKLFKKTVKALEANGQITLDSDGLMSLVETKDKKKKKKKKKDDKKDKKKNKREEDEDEGDDSPSKKKSKLNEEGGEEEEEKGDDKDNEQKVQSKAKSGEDRDKNKPCKGNPLGVTRLFLGNLPFAVDETSLNEFAAPAIITHIKWITDKETGKFYGSSFVEMKTAKDAAIVVNERNGEKIMGRPLKINYAPSREGDIWPPKSKEITGNGGQAGGAGVKGMSEKPDNCMKLFMGNLSFDIDDDTIVKFFANVDSEVKAVRWLHHKDSGDFKGW